MKVMPKKIIPLLLSGIAINFGLISFATQAQAAVSNAQVAAMVEALRQAAPQTGIKNDGFYSEWQVKPETLRGWSRFCLHRELTPAQFESSPVTARAIITCIVNRELNNQFRATNNNEIQAVSGVACWWMTGKYTGCDQGFTANYVQRVVGFYQQQRRSAAITPSASPTPSSR